MSISNATGWYPMELYSDDEFEMSEEELGPVIDTIQESINEETEDNQGFQIRS